MKRTVPMVPAAKSDTNRPYDVWGEAPVNRRPVTGPIHRLAQMTVSFAALRMLLPLAIIVSSRSSVFAQGGSPLDAKVIPPGPEAASLGKYIDMPVSTYTGLPNISIPIYELKSHQLSVPVSLSYHASGVNMDEVASFAGAGWSLNAGGMVSRTVRGLADEHMFGYFSVADPGSLYGVAPFFTATGEVNDGYITGNVKTTGYANTCGDGYANIFYASRGGVDLEPDMFFFSLPDGQSAKFLYDRAGEIHTIPKQYADIEYTEIPGLFTTFKITGRDGTRYYFEALEATRGTNYCGGFNFVAEPGQRVVVPADSVATTWKLSRMETPSGDDWIEFEYENETLTYDLPLSVTTYDNVGLASGVDRPAPADCGESTSVHSKRISSIKTKAGYEMYFYARSARQDVQGGYSLDSIRIQYQGVELKTVRFTHDYAIGVTPAGGDTYANSLLMLSSVREYKASKPLAPPYGFEYYPGTVPYQRNSMAVDHWGYSNGATGNESKSPAVIYDGKYYTGADREPVLEYCRQWALKKTTYPTGGTVQYDYELHDYTNVPSYTDFRYSPGLEELAGVEFQYTNNISDNYSGTVTFTVTEATDVAYLYNIPAIPGDGIPASGCGGTLTKTGSPAYSFNFLSGGGNSSAADIITIPPGTYTLTGGFTPSAFSWGDVDFRAQPFYIKIYKVLTQEEQLAANALKGGGLRIKAITTVTGGSAMTKSYVYTHKDSTASSGKIMSFPLYAYLITAQTDQMGCLNTCCVIQNSGTFMARASVSNYPLTTGSGSYVGYDEVIEYDGNAPAPALPGRPQPLANNGFSVYTFENHPDEDAIRTFPISPKTDYAYMNGLLKERSDYTRDGSLIRQVSNTYSFSEHERMGYGIKIAQTVMTGCTGCENRTFAYSTYENVSDLIRLDSSSTKTWDGGAYNETTTSYVYDGYDQVVYTNQGTSTPGRSLQTAYEYHPVNHTARTKEYTVYATSSGAHIWKMAPHSGKKTVYDSSGRTTKEIWLLATEADNAPVPDDSLFEKRLEYDIITPTGKIRQYHKTGEGPTSVIWGYGTAGDLFPVAQVLLADTASIAYTSFETPLSEKGGWTYDTAPAALDTSSVTGKVSYLSQAAVQTGRQLRPGQYIVSYWATPGSVSFTDASNARILSADEAPAKTSGQWALVTKRITLPEATVVKLYPAAGVQLDELRLYPVGAQMTTYTYDVGTGMTSATDANNTTVYYVYDDRGRLAEIRDADKNKVRKLEYHYQLGDN